MIAITNAKVVLETEILLHGVILIEGDTIVKVGSAGETDIPAGAQIVDAGDAYVGPGFVDIHVHGGGGNFFEDDPEKAAAHFLAHGETTVLATLYYNLSKEGYLAAIEKIRAAMERGNTPIKGLYMEGPYMNPKYGAMPEKNKWRGEITPDRYRQLVDAAGNLAKVWAVAPEREGIEDFVRCTKKVNPEAVIAVGHSEATPAQIRQLKKYGLTLQTHCMDATGQVTDWAGTRGAGPDEACLLDADMYAELICDSMGVHVNPDLINLILQVKGWDKVVLITDSFVSDAPGPEGLRHAADLIFDDNRNLCGSRLTMDAACRNLMTHTGCSLQQAFLLASRNPARAIGLDHEIGTIAEGKKADLVFVDHTFRVKKVMHNGRETTC